MRLTKLILGTLVLAVSFHPLFAQMPAQTAAARAQLNTTATANKFDLAQASGFDFARVSGVMRESINKATVIWKNRNHLASNPASDRDPNRDVCYNLRVYNFKHEDDEPPQMAGSTACTPASRFFAKSIELTTPVPQAK